MAKQYELAEKDYILEKSYKEIAEKYNVTINTVKSWKKRHGWKRDKPIKKSASLAPSNKKGCTPNKEVQEPKEELSDKEQLFCYHYVHCWNATQAALKSGYSPNRASAQVAGARLLQRNRVKQEVARLKELLTQEVHIEAVDVLQQYIKIAFADIGDYVVFGQKEIDVVGMFGPVTDPVTGKTMKQKVNYVDAGESEQLDTSVISKVKQGKEGFAIEFHDKMKALEKLEMYFDLLPDKFKRRIEEEKLKLERKKVENSNKEPIGNVNVIFNIPRPTRGEVNV